MRQGGREILLPISHPNGWSREQARLVTRKGTLSSPVRARAY